MSFLVQDAIAVMEEIAPLRYAESWDPTGLQIGNPQAPVQKIAFALDATMEIVREAIDREIDLLIVHHPLFFKPLKKLDLASPEGRLIEEAIRAGLAVYAAHTNLDSAPGGLNDVLCRGVGLENLEVLDAQKEESLYHLHLEIPESAREGVDLAASSLNCRFSWCQALGGEAILGRAVVEAGKRSALENDILSLAVPLALYWSPAGNRPLGAGLGRIGTLATPLSLEALALKLKDVLGISHVRMVGEGEKIVRRLAVCSGSGASLIPAALGRKADCLLTGDVKYHEAMTALDQGLLLLDAGHFGTEHIVVALLRKTFEEKLHLKGARHIRLMGLEGRDPFQVI